MKRFLRYTIRIILSVLFILVLIPSLLYIPGIQTFVKNKAATILSQKTGWTIEIDRFRIHFPLDLELSGVNGYTSKGDTLFHLKTFQTGVSFMPLLHGKVVIANLFLEDISSDMDGLIDGFDFQGKIGSLKLSEIDISLSGHTGDIKNIALNDANVRMSIAESTPDTTKKESTPINWNFRIGQLQIKNSEYALKMVESGLDLACKIGKGSLQQGNLLLDKNIYKVKRLKISDSFYTMNLDTLPAKSGFDPNHISLTDINIQADSIYNQGTLVKACIDAASFKERSGFKLNEMKGSYFMDSLVMDIDNLHLITPFSKIELNAHLDQSVFAKPRKGSVLAKLDGQLGRQDVLYFISAYSPEAHTVYPSETLHLFADIKGNMDRLDVHKLDISLPTALEIGGNGYFNKLNDEKKTSAEFTLNGNLENLSFVPLLLPDTSLRNSLTIPRDIHIEGNLFAEAGQYTGALNLEVAKSRLSLKGGFYPAEEQYTLLLESDNFELNQFLPASSLGLLTMHLKANGTGFDPFMPSFNTDIQAGISRLDINKYKIQSFTLDASVHKSNYDIKIAGADTILKMDLNMDGVLTKKEITAKLIGNLQRIDLYNLKLLDTETIVSAEIEASASTNMKDDYQLDLEINKMQLRDKGVLNKLGNLLVNAEIDKDSTRFSAINGDLEIRYDAASGLDSLLSSINTCQGLLSKQVKERYINIQMLQQILPDMILQVGAGTQNALYGYFKATGLQYSKAAFLVSNEKQDGFRINGAVNDLKKDTFLINNINLDIVQKEDKIDYQIAADSRNKNPMKAFNANASGVLERKKLSLDLLYKNGNDQIGLDMGLRLLVSPKEMSLHMEPYDPVILYRKWTLNPDNFIAINSDKHLLANFQLTGEKGMQLSLHSKDTLLAEGKSGLDVAISKFDISQISSVLPDFPPFSGMFNADMNVSFDNDQLDAKGNATLDSLYYNKRLMGDLALDVNYESSKIAGQWAYAAVNLDNRKVLEGDLSMVPKDSIGMAAHVFLYELPLKLADPFIPDAMASLTGDASGEITMEKIHNEPFISGKIDLDTAAVTISYANATYRLDNKPLIIEHNMLKFNNYQIFAYNKNPLVVDGVFNFTDFNKMIADLRITGDNVELLNVEKEKNQMIYGRLMMNVNTSVTGPLNLLKIRGNINLLTGTNVNYVLLDSPVSAQNRVSNLVTFTSFNDTIDSNYKVPLPQASLSGINMLVTINIAPTVQVGIDLSTNGDDRVELQGGGDLAFRMTPMGETDLSGRYSLSGGFVRYNLPILPVAKTFNIQNGSYVDWSGQLMDPYVNITASETVRTTITEEGKGSRVVVFQPMIEITNRLENLNIVFTVQAPEDMNIQNQLAQMTPEERSRQAMNLIITQTYSGPGTSSKANGNNALNAFIQKEINSFAGSALKGVDLSFGIDTYNQFGAEGQSTGSRTDYSFRFSKTLFNDRFRIIVGGTVSSGQDVSNDQAQNFIDDVTLEYMLDRSGTRLIKLFHNSDYESILEGEIVETGIGAVFKRRVRKLRQLFIFNDKKLKRVIDKEPEKEVIVPKENIEAVKPDEIQSEKSDENSKKLSK